MTLDPALFRSILGRFATGVAILTAQEEDGTDHGMTVSAFSSLSLDPPLVLACVERTTVMHRVLTTADRFAISILAEGQEALSRRFSEPIDDRFDGIGIRRGVTGAPLIEQAVATLECTLQDRLPGGDHVIYTGLVLTGDVHGGPPLIYYRSGYTTLGA